MAGGGRSPGSSPHRYEAVSGGASKRTLIYLARRYLKMSRQEWDDLPWWEAHALIEGFEAEGIIGDGPKGQGSNGTPSPVDLSGGDLTGLGFSTRRAG